MFPKFNLSRLSSFAALGALVAVLGGCAESTSGMAPGAPDTVVRQDPSRFPLQGNTKFAESSSSANTRTVTAEPRKVALLHGHGQFSK